MSTRGALPVHSWSTPRTHVSGLDYLAIVRRQRREPPRPYTFDCRGIGDAEYLEVVIAASRFVGIVPGTASAPLLQLTADWP